MSELLKTARKNSKLKQAEIKALEKRKLSEEEKKKQERIQRMIKTTIPKTIAELESKIEKQSKLGHYSIIYQYKHWDNSYSLDEFEQLEISRIQEYFKEEGFKVEDHYSREDPVGSDPMFYNTVYDRWLSISWDK